MTDNLFVYDDISQPQAINRWDAPTPGYFGGSSVYSPSPSPHCTLQQQPPDRLGFLPLAEWEEEGEYDEQPPKYICYTIEWKLVLNHKTAGRITKKDLAVAPSDYWKKVLKASLEDMLQAKRKRNHRVRSEGTNITVSVNDRTQTNLEDFASSTDIDWTPVERQLRKWTNLLRIGKKIHIAVVFNYRQDYDDNPMPTSRRGEKRGRVSATKIMLDERDAYIAAEEERNGRPSSWNLVYELMQCNVSSCRLNSDWCWEDPNDGKHYKLREPHIERLIDYVDKGGTLEGHDDVPRDIRRDLVRESQTGRKSKKVNSPTTGASYPPVSINVLPAPTPRASVAAPSPPRPFHTDEHPVILGPREEAVRKYCKWLESRATEEAYKADFRRVCEVTLDNLMDLELILKNPDPSFFIERGIKPGTALHFVGDIHEWAENVETDLLPEEGAEETFDDIDE